MTAAGSPSPLSPLIGREAERDEVERALGAGARLCTLVGPGGIGKTRLAHEICTRIDGVFCDLSAARTATEALAAIAATLDLRATDADIDAAIERALDASKPSVLVIDNVEQITDALAPVVARWLRVLPTLSILATSRERLGIDGEELFVIEPLSTTPRGALSAAAELFARRARAHGAKSITDAEAEAVAGALEGVPLAIELAAARVKSLGINALIDARDGLLDALRSVRRDAPSRHETLRRTIDWSWQLLSERERSAFAACGAFRGSFDHEAASAVLSDDRFEASQLAQTLVERSLLRSLDGARLTLFEPLRTYAYERLVERGELDRATARHRAFFAARARRLSDAFERSASAANLAAIERDRDDLTLVAHDLSHPREALCALVALDPLARLRGTIAAQEESLTSTLSLYDGRDALRAEGLRARGRARLQRGAHSLAREDYDAAQSLAIALEAGSLPRISDPLARHCTHQSMLHASSVTSRESEDQGCALSAQLSVERGVLAQQRRELDEAQAHYLAARRSAVEASDALLLARVEANLAAVAHDRGELVLAAEGYRTALAQLSSLDERRIEGITRSNLALVLLEMRAQAPGDPTLREQAERQFDRASALLEECGDRRLFAINEGNRALLAHESGRLVAAKMANRNAAEILASLGDVRSEGLCRARLGGALAELGELDAARRELARAESLLERADDRYGLEALSLHRALLALCEARREARATGDARVWLAQTAEVRALLASTSSHGQATRSLSDDVRIASTIVSRALDAPVALDVTPAASATITRENPRNVLVIGPEALWFRIDDQPVNDLRAYGPLRRVLEALVRTQSDRSALTIEALFAAGWPAERAIASAASNRVHVTLSDLRRRGLRPWIVQREGQYVLSDALAVERSELTFHEPAAPSRRGQRRDKERK
ncbi:MAG: AAA family ATPase [Polyangiales bacterium]